MSTDTKEELEILHQFSFYNENYGFFRYPFFNRVTIKTNHKGKYYRSSESVRPDGSVMDITVNNGPTEMDTKEYITWLGAALINQLGERNEDLVATDQLDSVESEQQFMGYF